MDFRKAKEQYEQQRLFERNRIARFLRTKGFETRALQGTKQYKASGRMQKLFDMSRWKWVTASKDGWNYFISLQAFDFDPRSGNHHVLNDRIGIYCYPGDRKLDYDPMEALFRMQITDLELPLSEYDLGQLAKLLTPELYPAAQAIKKAQGCET